MDTFEYKGKTFKMIPTTGFCHGCYGYDLELEAGDDFCDDAVGCANGGCRNKIAVEVIPEQIHATTTKQPKVLKNDYVVVRRIQMNDTEEDWEEFESTVRGFMNGGYELVGGISLTYNNGCVTVAQAIIKNKQEK